MASTQLHRKRAKLKFWLLYAGFLGVVLLGALGLAELGVRFLVPPAYWRFCVAKDDWQPDPQIGWVNRYNLDVRSRDDDPAVISFRLNEDGLEPHTATEAKAQNLPRIMLFGDSATVGRAVPEESRLAPQLSTQLQSLGSKVEVICAGVQGYSTDQSLLLMQRLLPRYRPDVVIHVVCDNDFGGNESPAAYGLAKPQFALEESGKLKLTTPAAAEIERRWKAGGGSGLRSYLQHSAVYRMIQPGLLRLRFGTDWRQANLQGGGMASAQVASMAKADWELFGALVGKMEAVCREHGAAFILTEHPHVWEVWATGATAEERVWLNRKLLAVTEARQVRFCEVVPYYLTVRDEGPFHRLPRDPHCNARGYEVTARILATYLQANGLAVKAGED